LLEPVLRLGRERAHLEVEEHRVELPDLVAERVLDHHLGGAGVAPGLVRDADRDGVRPEFVVDVGRRERGGGVAIAEVDGDVDGLGPRYRGADRDLWPGAMRLGETRQAASAGGLAVTVTRQVSVS